MPSERRLNLVEQLPRCPVARFAGRGPLDAVADWSGLLVLDSGCGDAASRARLEARGARYVGLDPYSGASDLVCPGSRLPLADASVDVVVSHGVLHLVPDPLADAAEIGRVLRPGGLLVGYVAFLEPYQEHSRFHVSHEGLRELAERAGLELREIGVGAFGVDYAAGYVLVPYGLLPPLRRAVRATVRALVRSQVAVVAAALAARGMRREGGSWYLHFMRWRDLFTLSLAAGFSFVMRKPGAEGPVARPAAELERWEDLLRCPRTGSRLRTASAEETARLPQDADRWLVTGDGGTAYRVRGRQRFLAADAAVTPSR